MVDEGCSMQYKVSAGFVPMLVDLLLLVDLEILVMLLMQLHVRLLGCKVQLLNQSLLVMIYYAF